ncbi:MAG TPA: hypothetical protein VOA64_12080 [Candidatus Dormibacteraeota bacterium]|nr:hypothetical protein [Candidatus Dormibacteraeota bacterium]
MSALAVANQCVAKEPPADLCALLPPSEVEKVMGKPFGAAEKSKAASGTQNMVAGAQCDYHSTAGAISMTLIAFVDTSPEMAKENFKKFKMMIPAATPVSGVGEDAYMDARHAIHAVKGKVRWFISADVDEKNRAKVEQQVTDLAKFVASKL